MNLFITGAAVKKLKTEQITSYPLINVLYRKLYDIKSWGCSQGYNSTQLESFVKEVEVEVEVHKRRLSFVNIMWMDTLILLGSNRNDCPWPSTLEDKMCWSRCYSGR